jgi:hypothetical protein
MPQSHARPARGRLRLVGLLLALALTACQSNQPAEPDQSLATAPDFSPTGTAPLDAAVAGIAVSGASDHPNQPAGLTTLAQWAMTSLFPMSTHYTSGYGIQSGSWWRFNGGLTAATDAAAPKSPSSVVAFHFPAGLQPGTSPGMFLGWANGSQTEYSKIYESGWVKIPSSTFEQHGPSGGLKMLGFWGSGVKNGVNNNLIGWTTARGSSPTSAFTFELRQQNFVTRNLTPNLDTSARFTCGTWHHYELLMGINSVGVANGTFQMWWDGVKTHNYTNVVYRTSAYPAKFFSRKWDPVWGGNGGNSKARTDVLLIDDLYIAGAS